MRNCFSNCATWRSKKRTTAALRTLFSQLHAFPTALRSCASLVSIFRPCHAVCIASVAASLSLHYIGIWGDSLSNVGLLNIDNTTSVNREKMYLVFLSMSAACVLCVFSSHSFWTSNSLDIPAGVTGGRSHRISHPPFCGACLNFSRKKESAIPFPHRP